MACYRPTISKNEHWMLIHVFIFIVMLICIKYFYHCFSSHYIRSLSGIWIIEHSQIILLIGCACASVAQNIGPETFSGKLWFFKNLFRLNACRYISLRLFFKSYQISHVSLNVSLNFSIKKLFKTPDGDYLCSHAVYKLNVKDFQLHT